MITLHKKNEGEPFENDKKKEKEKKRTKGCKIKIRKENNSKIKKGI